MSGIFVLKIFAIFHLFSTIIEDCTVDAHSFTKFLTLVVLKFALATNWVKLTFSIFFFFFETYTTQKSISNCNVNRYLCVSNSTGFGETGSYQNLRSHFSNNNFKYENVVFTMKEVLTQLFWLFHMYCWNKLSEKYRITNHSFNFWLTFYSNYTYYILTDTIF